MAKPSAERPVVIIRTRGQTPMRKCHLVGNTTMMGTERNKSRFDAMITLDSNAFDISHEAEKKVI